MKIPTIGRWGRFPLFPAKIGSGPSAAVLIKRVRDFTEGQRLDYADVGDLEGMSTACTPPWRRAYIWKIDGERLFLAKI